MTSDSPVGLERFASKWPPRKGRVLVVGSKVYGKKQDRRELYKKAVGLDLFPGEGVDIVHDLESPLPDELGKFAHVDCVSVLEHVKRPWLMAANIEAALVENGTLLICVPFVWRVHAYPGDYWRMTTEALEVLFPNIQWHSRKYLVEGQQRNLVRGKRDPEGQWMQRAELAAAGVKCSSMS